MQRLVKGSARRYMFALARVKDSVRVAKLMGASNEQASPVRRAIAQSLIAGASVSAAAALDGGAQAFEESGEHQALRVLETVFTTGLLGLLLVLAIIGLSVVLAYILPFLANALLRRFGVARHWRVLVRFILSIAVVLIGFWIALAAIGIDLGQILLGFGFISIALSAGLGAAIANVVAGLTLQTSDDIAVGHYVRVGGYTGRVVETNISSVRLAVPDDEDENIVVLPNSFIASRPIELFGTQRSAPAFLSTVASARAQTALDAYDVARRRK